MVQTTVLEERGDRIVLILDPGGPIELTGLSDSFAALARYYERHYRPQPDVDTAPKLFITRLSTGSIVAEIAPYVVLFGQAFVGMGGAITVADFTNRFVHAIRAFTDPHALQDQPSPLPPTREDAADLREFMRPLTGRPVGDPPKIKGEQQIAL
jgi:hypothetical protein